MKPYRIILTSLIFIYFSSICLSQNADIISTPTLLFWGHKYRINKIKYDSLSTYFLKGNGFIIENFEDYYTAKPTFNGEFNELTTRYHYLDFCKIFKNDTILIERRYYEIISCPEPDLLLGEYDNLSTIYLSYKEIDKIKRISLINGWVTEFSNPHIIDAYVTTNLSKKEYKIINNELSEEFIKKELPFGKKITLTFYTKYTSKDIGNSFYSCEFNIYIMGVKETFKSENPYYDLYKNKHVERIGTWTIEEFDTLEINNSKKDLFFHFVGLGTENTFTLKTLDSKEILSYDNLRDNKILIKAKKLHGKYILSFWGDGGKGDILLIIK